MLVSESCLGSAWNRGCDLLPFLRGRYREKGKGRHKQSKAKNLLDALLERADQVLARLIDLRIPFTNNQAEGDLSMAKVGT